MRLLLILFLAFALWPSTSKSQYQSFFGKDSTSWNSLIMDIEGYIMTDSVVYEKDTTIQLMTYKKINWYIAAPYNAYFTKSFLREDTTTGRLWQLIHPDSSEKLVIDMSLNLSDNFADPLTGILFTVDSVYSTNGRKNVRLNAVYQSGKLTFIEGVGTNRGIIDHSFTGSFYLLCQKKDGSMNYINSHPVYQGLCNIGPLNVGRSPVEEQYEISPNPTSGLISIRTTDLDRGLFVRVLDMTGRVLINQACDLSPVCSISFGELPGGIYLVQVRNSRNSIVRLEKIILLK
jgi:hypothetical protein